MTERVPRWRPSADVVSTEIPGGGRVLLDLASDLSFQLNPVGCDVWDGLQEGLDEDAIVDRICRRFHADQQRVRADVERLLREMSSRGLVTTEIV